VVFEGPLSLFLRYPQFAEVLVSLGEIELFEGGGDGDDDLSFSGRQFDLLEFFQKLAAGFGTFPFEGAAQFLVELCDFGPG
jgi:hypothetical protein